MFNGGFTDLLLVALAATLVVAAVIDVRTFTISNRLSAAVALGAPLYWLSISLAPWPGMAAHVAAAVVVFLLLAGAFYAGMMGGGDVKLAAALSLWFPIAVTVKFWCGWRWPAACSRWASWSGIAPVETRAVRKFHMGSQSRAERYSYSRRF